jgi:hypothetical protein
MSLASAITDQPSASCAITASGVVDGRRRPQLLTFSPKVCSRHKRIDLVLRPPDLSSPVLWVFRMMDGRERDREFVTDLKPQPP